MSVMADIAASYRGPVPVLRRRIAGEQESRALAILMAGCVLLFIAQWPRLSRQAFETGAEVQMLIGGWNANRVPFNDECRPHRAAWANI